MARFSIHGRLAWKLIALGASFTFLLTLYTMHPSSAPLKQSLYGVFSQSPLTYTHAEPPSFSTRCSPQQWSAGQWRAIPPRSSPEVTGVADVLALDGFSGCAADREYLWHLGAEEDQWGRYPDVASYVWTPPDECHVRPLEKENMVRDMVEEGGWLLLGGEYSCPVVSFECPCLHSSSPVSRIFFLSFFLPFIPSTCPHVSPRSHRPNCAVSIKSPGSDTLWRGQVVDHAVVDHWTAHTGHAPRRRCPPRMCCAAAKWFAIGESVGGRRRGGSWSLTMTPPRRGQGGCSQVLPLHGWPRPTRRRSFFGVHREAFDPRPSPTSMPSAVLLDAPRIRIWNRRLPSMDVGFATPHRHAQTGADAYIARMPR